MTTNAALISFTVTGVQIELLVRRLFYLAWKASVVIGRGVLQDRGHQDDNTVWCAVFNKDDYPRFREIVGFENKPGEVDADYVFGRMMKLRVRWRGNVIEFDDREWRPDYQTFCRVYPNPESLIHAAAESIGGGATIK